MRKGWIKKSIEEIARFSQGIQVGVKEQETSIKEGYVRFIRIVDYTQNTDDIRYVKNPGSKYYVHEDDIVMVRYGSPGLIGRGKAGVIANNLFKITITDEGITNDYLCKFLSQDHIQTYLSSQGSATMPALNFGQLRKVQVQFPSAISEQKQIVSILDQAFEAIDQAKANIEKNIENAKELFQSKLNEIFSQKGEGWEDVDFSDESILKIIDGDRGKNYPKKSDFKNQGHCVFLNTGNVRPNGFDFKEVVFVDQARDNLLRKGKLKRGDVVMTTRGTIGNVAWYNSEVIYDHIRINSGMLIFRLNQEKILPEYFFTLLRSSIVTKQILEKTSGAAQPQLPIKSLITFKIPFNSDLDLQRSMVNRINDLESTHSKLLEIYSNKITLLGNLKKSLLQKAFSGELTANELVL